MTRWRCTEDARAREEIAVAVQVSEDTCAEHGVFCCAECFETEWAPCRGGCGREGVPTAWCDECGEYVCDECEPHTT